MAAAGRGGPPARPVLPQGRRAAPRGAAAGRKGARAAARRGGTAGPAPPAKQSPRLLIGCLWGDVTDDRTLLTERVIARCSGGWALGARYEEGLRMRSSRASPRSRPPPPLGAPPPGPGAWRSPQPQPDPAAGGPDRGLLPRRAAPRRRAIAELPAPGCGRTKPKTAGGARGGAPRPPASFSLCPFPLPCPEKGSSPTGFTPAEPWQPRQTRRPAEAAGGEGPRVPRVSKPGRDCRSLTLVDSAGSWSFPGKTSSWSRTANSLARSTRLAWCSGYCTVA